VEGIEFVLTVKTAVRTPGPPRSLTMSSIDIDALYAGFCSSLPFDLAAVARNLPYRLGLGPIPELTFSQVFSHEVTLAAPMLVGEAFETAPPAAVRGATLAHLLAVVDAFGRDRLADGQIEATVQLGQLLDAVRRARDVALATILPAGAELSFVEAERLTEAAIAAEREILFDAGPVSLDRYQALSLDKQRVGFVGSRALALAAGADAATLERIEHTLASVALALQFEDDVVDWQDDFARGGAWAVCLARGMRTLTPVPERRTEPNPVLRRVLDSGVLAALMDASRDAYRQAWRRARSLGAHRLAAWAERREVRAAELARYEARSPGYVVRQRSLAPWAAEVMR
jgi:hypothetical protein